MCCGGISYRLLSQHRSVSCFHLHSARQLSFTLTTVAVFFKQKTNINVNLFPIVDFASTDYDITLRYRVKGSVWIHCIQTACVYLQRKNPAERDVTQYAILELSELKVIFFYSTPMKKIIEQEYFYIF